MLGIFDRPDNEIRDEATEAIIVRDFSLDPGAFDVTVRSGIVTITGLAGSRAIAVRLIGALWHAEGMVDMRDGLSFLPGGPA